MIISMKSNDDGCSLAIIHDLGCDWRQFFVLLAFPMGDLQRRPEPVCPVRAVFAGSPRLESFPRKIEERIPVSRVIVVSQTIRVALFVRE